MKNKTNRTKRGAVAARVGYLFTDIDGSVQRWEKAPSQMKLAMARHDAILDELVARHGGVIQDRAGDGIFAVFTAEKNPLACALDIQLALQAQDWSAIGGLSVRVGVHAGGSIEGAAPDRASANRAARIMSSGWGGQIIVSAQAVDAYPLPRDSVLDDLGVCHLRGIEEPLKLLGLVHPDLERRTFPPLRSLAVYYSTLPVQASPLCGRARELQDVNQMLRATEARIVTVVGPGGNGKTRLVVEAAAGFAQAQPVYFISFEGSSRQGGLISALAAALRFPFHGSAPPEEQLIDYLRERKLLLVLDNVEVEFSGKDFIDRLTALCPRLKILAAGRTPLHVRGETLYRLGGLECADARLETVKTSPAFELFALEMGRLDLDFKLTEASAATFFQMCSAVGGSPLGLHLVAQWSRVLGLDDILARLKGGVDFLSHASDAAASVPALRDIFEGTWSLLNSTQQCALAQLSVFSGGFESRDAEAVGGVNPATLLDLEDRGLIERAGSKRFAIHALIQEYALEKLAIDGAAFAKANTGHAEHFLGLLRSCGWGNQRQTLESVHREISNLRTAWSYALHNGLEDLARQASEALFYLMVMRSRFREAGEFFNIATGDEELETYFGALLANCLVHQGEFENVRMLTQQGLEQPSDALAHAHAHQAMGNLHHIQGEFPEALSHYTAALSARERVGDEMGLHYSSLSLAALHVHGGNSADARERLKQSYRICRRIGNAVGLMHGHILAGDIALAEDRPEDARSNYETSLELEEQAHNPQLRSIILVKLGAVLLRLGHSEAAVRRHSEAVELAEEVGDMRLKIMSLIELARDYQILDDLNAAKSSLLLAVRLGLRLGARALLVRSLLELARIELKLGNQHHARRLAIILAGAEAQGIAEAHELTEADLPAQFEQTGDELEAAIKELLMEADLAALRLD